MTVIRFQANVGGYRVGDLVSLDISEAPASDWLAGGYAVVSSDEYDTTFPTPSDDEDTISPDTAPDGSESASGSKPAGSGRKPASGR